MTKSYEKINFLLETVFSDKNGSPEPSRLRFNVRVHTGVSNDEQKKASIRRIFAPHTSEDQIRFPTDPNKCTSSHDILVEVPLSAVKAHFEEVERDFSKGTMITNRLKEAYNAMDAPNIRIQDVAHWPDLERAVAKYNKHNRGKKPVMLENSELIMSREAFEDLAKKWETLQNQTAQPLPQVIESKPEATLKSASGPSKDNSR